MANTPSTFALTDSILFTGDVFVEGHALIVSDGHILDIVPKAKVPANLANFSYPHAILAPGFIDCQVNGGNNVLFNAQPTAEGALAIAAAHRKTGTTRILPNIITDAPEITAAAIHGAREARKTDPSILGIHVEGPHLNPEMCGIHDIKHIRPMSEADLFRYKREGDEVFLLTLAPESVLPEQIKILHDQGVIISIGHSNPTREQFKAALEAGVSGFTHLFTRTPPMRGRFPGVGAFALDTDSLFCAIIGDGHHVEPEMLRLALKAKAPGTLFFVSDAQAPAGAEKPEPFELCGEMIYPGDGLCRDGNGTIAGSMKTLGQIVSEMIKELKLDPGLVLRMASAVPAAFLGLDKKLGYLLPGFEADIVALDHNFKAEAVWRKGEKVV